MVEALRRLRTVGLQDTHLGVPVGVILERVN